MRGLVLRMVTIGLIAGALAAVPTAAGAADPTHVFSRVSDAIWMTDGDGYVLSMAQGGNRVFLGGTFRGMQATYNGTPVTQRYVASVDVWSGEFIPGFDPVLNNEVRAVAVSPDGRTVYVGGLFDTVNGESRRRLVALDAVTGNIRPAFDVDIASGNVEALQVKANGDVIVGGSFSRINNQTRKSVAIVDGVTGALRSFNANAPAGKVESLLLTESAGRLYIGTSRDNEEGRPMFGELLAVDPDDGSPISGFNARTIDNPVLDIAVSDEKIYVAMGGGGGTGEILRLSDGGRRRTFFADGDVQTVAVVGNRATFAGHWTEHFGSYDSFRIITFDTEDDRSVDTSWRPSILGTNGLHDILYDGYHLWMGGNVRDANPVSRRGFVRYSPEGAAAPLTPLLDEGAKWKYLDDGSQLGSGWRRLTYDDSAWRSGRSELGYGDGGEATVVRDGPNTNRYITTYFRRELTVAEPGDIGYLEIRLKRDDGAVVYLNGAEVVRDNLPSGTITGATRALAPINGDDEDEWTRWIVSPSLLVPGDNIVAVEIHQVTSTSNDISFDLRLLADSKPQTFLATGARWRYRDDGPSLASAWRRLHFNDSSWKVGASQLGYGEGDQATTIARGPKGDRHITSYFRKVFTVYDLDAVPTLELELLRDDGAVVYLNEVEVVRSNMPAGPINSEVTALELASFPGEQDWYRYAIDPRLLVEGDNIIAVEIHQKGPYSNDHSFDLRLALQASPEVLLKRDLKWRYSDNGIARSTPWRDIEFKYHRKWPRGRAQLGYGDGDETTVIDSGPSGDHHITTYFRRWFDVNDPGVFSVLDIGLVRDDGAVVYVNGVEVLRSNMPSGTIRFDTRASGGTSNENSFRRFTVPANMLVAGRNVVAVEVHQSSPGSSDVSFNFEMTGR